MCIATRIISSNNNANYQGFYNFCCYCHDLSLSIATKYFFLTCYLLICLLISSLVVSGYVFLLWSSFSILAILATVVNSTVVNIVFIVVVTVPVTILDDAF